MPAIVGVASEQFPSNRLAGFLHGQERISAGENGAKPSSRASRVGLEFGAGPNGENSSPRTSAACFALLDMDTMAGRCVVGRNCSPNMTGERRPPLPETDSVSAHGSKESGRSVLMAIPYCG